MKTTMLDALKFQAQVRPDVVALYDIDNNTSYTWNELLARSYRMAAYLVDECELARGDMVATMCDTDIRVIDLFFASCLTGIIIDTLNPRLRAEEQLQMVESEGPRILFYSPTFEDKVHTVSSLVKSSLRLVSFDEDNACKLDAYVTNGTFQPIYPDSEDIQMLIHTGGTTGFPKAAMLSYRYFFMNAAAECMSWRLGRGDSCYIALPLFHTAGWNVSLMPMIMAGGTISMTARFSNDAFFSLIEQERLSIFMASDTVLHRIADDPRFKDSDCTSVRLFCCGASEVSLHTLEAFWNRGLRLIMGYGMTEYGPNTICPGIDFSLEENHDKPFIIGKPLMFTQTRIVTPDGRDAKGDEPGELYLKGDLGFSGYWKNECATREMLEDGWIKTGDIASYDAEGYITLRGRKKNVFISGGENIFPAEIERVLEENPNVKEACVIGVPDSEWGEVGKAILALHPGAHLEKEEIDEWLTVRLSTIKRPHYYAFVESIPTNTVGKRDLKATQERYGEPHDD